MELKKPVEIEKGISFAIRVGGKTVVSASPHVDTKRVSDAQAGLLAWAWKFFKGVPFVLDVKEESSTGWELRR